MVESFCIGAATAFLLRAGALRILGWPLYSSNI